MTGADAARGSTAKLGSTGEGILGATGAEITGEGSSVPRRKVGLKPGTRWDGRVSNLSLKDYRELKWNLDAAYAKVERRGPSYTCRAYCPMKSKSSPVFQRGDPVKAMDAARPRPASCVFGVTTIAQEITRSPGPAQYSVRSTMDPNPHPMLKKSCGAKFGTEVLNATDEPSPAPGDYEVIATFKKSGACPKPPNYTVQGREAWFDPTAAPGPGVGDYPGLEHCQRHGKNTPITWTLQGKTEPIEPARGERKNETPGPPHYNCPGAGLSCKNEVASSTKRRSAAWKQGSESRGLV